MYINTIQESEDMDDNDRLRALWNGRDEYVVDGSVTYRVLTPDGPEHPIFVPIPDSTMYGSLSMTVPTSKPKSSPKINKKRSDLGDKS
jgi:hypothetical protein